MVSDGKPARCRVGIDVGGTFTDFVLANPLTGEIVRYKEPSVPSDPSLSVARGLPALIERAGVRPGDVELLVHGTTLLVNAIIQRRGARVGLVVSRGHRGVLEIGRMSLDNSFDFTLRKEAPLVPRNLVFETGHPGSRGRDAWWSVRAPRISIGSPPTFDAARVQAVTLLLLNSYAFPETERELAEALRHRLPGGPDHRVGRDLARAARVRARARRHHERVRAAPHERLSRSPGGTGGRDGGERADLHHRLERRDAQHRHRPGTADRHRAVRTRLGPRRGHARRPDPRTDRDHHR